ncbi:hypothetical protein BpHYR1_006454 [Brachionus plicatilis]|uniref:Uncharacterized protein n=1 Tax=Brachionus plicatilis TaxID=10195 RepID=A0A3M7Q1Y7_BRAPC|nr:hypothetical protein BpHYR1_006454 [Brachionus plicatilis]
MGVSRGSELDEIDINRALKNKWGSENFKKLGVSILAGPQFLPQNKLLQFVMVNYKKNQIHFFGKLNFIDCNFVKNALKFN